jgi:hypothetical protein
MRVAKEKSGATELMERFKRKSKSRAVLSKQLLENYRTSHPQVASGKILL